VLSGLLYQQFGLEGCLWASAGNVLVAGAISSLLPANRNATVSLASATGGGD